MTLKLGTSVPLAIAFARVCPKRSSEALSTTGSSDFHIIGLKEARPPGGTGNIGFDPSAVD